jgi:ubiquinone/menaquinone biosynthesis C-methylase UbiE
MHTEKTSSTSMTPEIVKKIIALYREGKNITEYLLSQNMVIDTNLIELIYDLQAGTYTQSAKKNKEFIGSRIEEIYSHISEYIDPSGIFLDAGVGEASTLVPLLKLVNPEKAVLAFDISLSRVKWAEKNLFENKINSILAVASLMSIPLADNSVDFTLTVHALEPNRGSELRILREINRVTRKFIFLVEPDYENSTNLQRLRMDKLSYIKELRPAIEKSGFELIKTIPLKMNINEENLATLYIAKKSSKIDCRNLPAWVDPFTKSEITVQNGYQATKEGFLFPIIEGIPLLRDNDLIYYLAPPKNFQ